MIKDKKIFIFGGSGSLGHAIIDRYLKDNTVINYSRDECKHWKMQLKYKSDKLSFIIGDIKDYNRVENSLLRENPNIIIIAAALKHIDRCEMAVMECVSTNFMGPMNVINAVEKNKDRLRDLECVLFVSTDKATNAISSYGAAKFLSERSIIEKSFYLKDIKLISIRYGNVINSNGSILKILKKQGKDSNVKEFNLTHDKMSRFWMTLNDSVNLLEYAILYAKSGEIIVPKLISINIKDLFEIFSEKYNKPIKITGLRSSEKLLESLISPTESLSLKKKDDYYHIKPHYKKFILDTEPKEYSSNINPLSKEELKEFLIKLDLF